MNDDSQCPLCGRPAQLQEDIERRITTINCNVCSTYLIDRNDIDDFLSVRGRQRWHPLRLSALAREQAVQSRPPLYIQFRDGAYPAIAHAYGIHADELLLTHWPEFPHVVDRMLLNFAAHSGGAPGEPFQLVTHTSFLFAESGQQANYYLRLLMNSREWIAANGPNYEITDAGWQRIAELKRSRPSADNPAFVAMWYGGRERRDEMNAVYGAIRAGVRRAGYNVTRADLEEHNEYVMNKILGDIRVAPFVVAEFTNHRNGVYFEAAFAKGLGSEVICCCRDGELRDAHFDTKQLNHILWESPDDLAERLSGRILGVLGRGPHQPSS